MYKLPRNDNNLYVDIYVKLFSFNKCVRDYIRISNNNY